MWTSSEDEKLRAAVLRRHGKKWREIAQDVETKNAKQCRRRWRDHLTRDDDVKTHEWTREEDEALFRARATLGNKWTAIASIVGGRTDNATKNRYAALVKSGVVGVVERRTARGKRTTTTTAERGRATSEKERTAARKRVKRKTRAGVTTERENGENRVREGVKRSRVKETIEGERATTSREAPRARAEGAPSEISPTLFALQSPSTSSFGGPTESASLVWRPNLSINVPSREANAGSAGKRGPLPSGGASEAFVHGVSLGRSLSLSIAELEILREVQDMVSPLAVTGSQGGSAFVRFNNKGAFGATQPTQSSSDVQDIMNWLLSATPTGETSALSNVGDVSVTLERGDDDSAAAERGATLKHFLSLKAAAASSSAPGARARTRDRSVVRPASPGAVSVPSFTSSELHLLLSALGSAPSAANPPPPSDDLARASPPIVLPSRHRPSAFVATTEL